MPFQKNIIFKEKEKLLFIFIKFQEYTKKNMLFQEKCMIFVNALILSDV